jgi:hypothetical protein
MQFHKTYCARVFFWERRALARPPRPRWSVAVPGEPTSTPVEIHYDGPLHTGLVPYAEARAGDSSGSMARTRFSP